MKIKDPMSQDQKAILALTAENERLHAHVTNANGRASDYENRLLAALNDNERLRGLLRVINAAPRHLEHGSYLVRLYHDDFERIAAAITTVQPDVAL